MPRVKKCTEENRQKQKRSGWMQYVKSDVSLAGTNMGCRAHVPHIIYMDARSPERITKQFLYAGNTTRSVVMVLHYMPGEPNGNDDTAPKKNC